MRKYSDKIFIVFAIILVITGVAFKKKIVDKKEKTPIFKREEKLEKINETEEKSSEKKIDDKWTNEEKDKSGKETFKNVEKGDSQVKNLKAYISGQVNKPGVYIFKRGDRVEDLVKKAGGFTKNADNSLNLALHLEDEMHIYVQDKRKKSASDYGNGTYLQNKAENLNSRQDYKNQKKEPFKSKEKVNINTASIEDLMGLPFIGEKKAEEIIEKRKMKSFESIDEIRDIKGIGEKIFEKLKDLITCN